MKLAFVVQRYGLEINGGAELHCRWVVEHLREHYDIEVLTTRAFDYVTWKDHYSKDEETINGITVRRFSVDRPRCPERFGRIQDFIFNQPHSEADELRWLDEEGPLATSLIRYIRDHRDDYDYFIFFSYRYYHSYWGIRIVPEKSILVPTAERDPVIHLGIFRDLLKLPRAFIYNSHEEKAMINDASGNDDVPGDIVGVGTVVPETSSEERFRKLHGVEEPYIIYIGRIDENKGCHKLFEYFLRFKKETDSPLKLVLIGSSILPVPSHPDVLHLGFQPEEVKFDALEGARILVMPSFYESLSMVTLEAWAMKKPVLANARCEVLKGQCLRSRAGLFYENYWEFREALDLLDADARLREVMGENGRRYYDANYTWDIVVGKYRTVIRNLESR